MTLAATMLPPDGLRVTEDGFELDVRLNWYRSLPLSSVATLDLTVNGTTVQRDEIAFSVNEQVYALDELARHPDDMWFVLDPATLRVSRRLVRPGEPSDVRLVLGTLVPYLLVAPGRPLEVVTERSATLVARAA